MPLKTAVLEEKTTLTDDVIELKFKTTENFNFKSGQFITIKINDKTEKQCLRAYSISSSPNDSKTFELCVKIIPLGRGSNWLNDLKKGDKIEFIGPSGKFIFQSDKNRKIIFIATGTGIAPLKSIIEDQLKTKNNQRMDLYFGLRHEKNIIYKNFFENLEKKYKNFKFNIILSRPEDNSWTGKRGRVTDIMENTKINEENIEFYICGLKQMVEDMENLLKRKKIPDKNIHFEKYD